MFISPFTRKNAHTSETWISSFKKGIFKIESTLKVEIMNFKFSCIFVLLCFFTLLKNLLTSEERKTEPCFRAVKKSTGHMPEI